MNEIPSFREDHISQIPALQLLIKLGFTYLSPEDALKERGSKSSNVILDNILKKQLHEINSIQYKGKDYNFSDANISYAVAALKNIDLTEGYINAAQQIYDLLTLGKSLEQSIDQDKKSFTLNYIDWQKPERNVFHVTAEYAVLRSGSKDHYRPDIVLFINGIPIVIIECKSPHIKEPLEQAISQNLRNQQDDGIRSLYKYAQILKNKGFDITFEKSIGEGKSVDVVATKNKIRIAVEVETGRSDILSNINKCLQAEFDRIIVVAINEKIESKVKSLLEANDLHQNPKIILSCARRVI